MTKKAGIYDPYLDTLGGGERYCLTVAEILKNNGYSVDIFWSGDQSLLEQAEKRFSLDLSKIKFTPDIFENYPSNLDFIEDRNILFKIIHQSRSPLKIRDKILKVFKKLKKTKEYDLIFFLSDGSIPYLFGKKNIFHVQVPFTTARIKNLPISNFLKEKFLNYIICNSSFTAKFTQKYFKKPVLVLYPPVDVNKFETDKNKDNVILNVGRFDNILNAKKQDVLLKAFKKMHDKKLCPGWKLVLAGGSTQSIEQNTYLSFLENEAKGYPVEFRINPDFNQLKKLYSKAKIYWHAAGYKVKQNIHPEYTEHFGMSIVESMSSGCAPVVIKKGGIPEIITNSIDGFTWLNIKSLIKKTHALISSPELLSKIQSNALINSKKFSKENFEAELLKLISKK